MTQKISMSLIAAANEEYYVSLECVFTVQLFAHLEINFSEKFLLWPFRSKINGELHVNPSPSFTRLSQVGTVARAFATHNIQRKMQQNMQTRCNRLQYSLMRLGFRQLSPHL